MEHYAGIDVSLEQSSVCVVDATGRIVRDAKVASEPEALVCLFRQAGVPVTRIGLEAGPLSQWLHAALIEAVAERAREQAAVRLYWLTQEGNAPARRLYDAVARTSGFIRYEYAL